MIITDDTLAAYIDGTLPQSQVEAVRLHLALHPQELEQMVRIMDKNPIIVRSDSKQSVSNVNLGRARTAANMAYSMTSTHSESKRKTNIMNNLDSLFKEIF